MSIARVQDSCENFATSCFQQAAIERIKLINCVVCSVFWERGSHKLENSSTGAKKLWDTSERCRIEGEIIMHKICRSMSWECNAHATKWRGYLDEYPVPDAEETSGIKTCKSCMQTCQLAHKSSKDCDHPVSSKDCYEKKHILIYSRECESNVKNMCAESTSPSYPFKLSTDCESG